MASFYGNIMTKNTMSNFSFDKIYSNRVAMQAAIGINEKGEIIYDKDGNRPDDRIFPGRYVLVEYGPQGDANIWRVGYAVSVGQEIYYCAEENDEELKSRFQYDDGTKNNNNKTEENVNKDYLITLNEYIRVKTDNNPYLYYRCKGADEKEPKYAAFEGIGKYNDNYQKDYEAYSQNYDSTVWVKQLSTTGEPSYLNVASLNTVVPSFDLTIHAPTTPMQKPHWSDTNSSNVYYNLHLQNQWGLDVENKDGKNFSWNADGFEVEKENIVDTTKEDTKDKIEFTQTTSNNKYYDDEEKIYKLANDTQVLNIALPSIGNIGAEVWNKVYEVGDEVEVEGSKIKYRKRDIDWQYKLQNPTTGEITNEEHNSNLHGKSIDTLTIAGNINKIHDLIGEIIIKDETDSIPAILASEDYIYKKSDGYYYVQHNNTYGDINKKVIINLSYDYSVAKTDYQMANTQKVLYETPFITKYGKNLVYDSTGIISAKFAEEHQDDLVDIAEGGEPGAQTKVKFAYEEYLLWAKPWVEKKKKVYFVAIKGEGLLDEEAVGSLYLNRDSTDQTKLEIPAGTILANDTPIWLKIDPEGASFNEMILKYRRLYSNNPDDFTHSFEGKSFMEFVREIQSEMGDASSYLDAQLQAFQKGIAARGTRADQSLKNFEADLQDRLSSEDYELGSADVALSNYKNELQNKTNEATTTLTNFTTVGNNSTTTIQNEVNKVTTKANSLLTQQDITSIAIGTTTGYIQISGNETQLGNIEYLDLLKVSSSLGHPVGAKGNFTFYITEIADSIDSLTYYATVNNGQIIDCNCENMFVYYWDQDSYDFNVQINKNNINAVCNKFFVKVVNNSSIDILTVEIPTTIQDNYALAINPTERLSLDLMSGNPQIFTGVYDIPTIPDAAKYIDVAYIDVAYIEGYEAISIYDICADFYLTFIKANGEIDTFSGPIKNFGNSSGPKQGYNSSIGSCFITKAAEKNGRLALQIYSSVAKRYAKILVKIVNYNLVNMVKMSVPAPETVVTSEPASFGAREPIYSPTTYKLMFEKIQFNLGYSVTGNEQIDFKGDDEENYYLAQGYLDKDGRFVHPTTSNNFGGALIKITILAAIKSETSSDAVSFVTLTGETSTIIKNGQRVFASTTLTQLPQEEQTAPASLTASFIVDNIIVNNKTIYFNKLLVTGPGGTNTANCRALIEITPSGSLNY